MSELIQSPESVLLLSVSEAARRLGVARRTLEREVARKRFPRPMKIGSKSVYSVSDLEGYVASLIAQREDKHAGRAP